MAYSLTFNKSSVDEGSSVIITLDNTGLPNFRLVPFTISGVNINSQDFLGLPALSGNFLIENGRGRVVLNLAQDFKTEGPETFVLSLTGRPESIGMLVNDKSLTPAGTLAEFSIVSNLSTVFEGQPVRFTVTATNIPPGTVVPWEVFGIQKEDILEGVTSGNLIFRANTAYDTIATQTFSLLEDIKTEGTENIVFIVKPDFPYSLKITSTVSIIDTSTENQAKYFITPDKTKVKEGDSVTFNVRAENVNVGDKVFWFIQGSTEDGTPKALNLTSDITLGDFENLTTLSGVMTFTAGQGDTVGNVSSLTLVTRDDYIYEQSEYFYLALNRNGKLTTSSTIEILDSGNTLLESDARYSGNAIVSFVEVARLQPVIGGLVTKPGYWKNSTGHLDDQNLIQGRRLNEDSTAPIFYQPFSYVIKSSQSIDIWSNSVKDLLHPAGFSFFSEINNETTFENVAYAGVKAVSDSDIDTYTPITADRNSGVVRASDGSINASIVTSTLNIF